MALASMVHFSQFTNCLHPRDTVPISLPNLLLVLLRGADSFAGYRMVQFDDGACRSKSLRSSTRILTWCGCGGSVCSSHNLPRLHSTCHNPRNLLRLRTGSHSRPHSLRTVHRNLQIGQEDQGSLIGTQLRLAIVLPICLIVGS